MIRGRAYSPIGIDLSTRQIRAVQLVRRRGAWRLHAAAGVPREGAPSEGAWTPASEAEYERLWGVLRRRGFEGSDVVLAVPADLMIESVVELPPRASGAPLAELAAAELGRVHKVDASTLQVAFWEVPAAARSGGTTEYMVVGCTERAALDLIDPFERLGMVVRALDVRGLSLQRACSPAIGAGGGVDAILCLGWNHTTLHFIVDGVVSFQRALDGCDGRTLCAGASQRLRMAPTNALSLMLRQTACAVGAGTPARREVEREIAACIGAHVESIAGQFEVSCAYIARRYPDRAMSRALVTGEFGTLPGLVERLERANLAARRFELADAVDTGAIGERSLLGTEFIASLGLAMRPLRGAA